jgi:hypothetical protein
MGLEDSMAQAAVDAASKTDGNEALRNFERFFDSNGEAASRTRKIVQRLRRCGS